jgi:hypothetical protein
MIRDPFGKLKPQLGQQTRLQWRLMGQEEGQERPSMTKVWPHKEQVYFNFSFIKPKPLTPNLPNHP